MNADERVIKSYVWHGDECFFVSTIERDCSAAACQIRYNETIVWRYNWEKRDQGPMIGQYEDVRGSIETHLEVCRYLHDCGKAQEEE